jgi:SpoVK/Ycf46/Vps4 family AAA+-type ATPase
VDEQGDGTVSWTSNPEETFMSESSIPLPLDDLVVPDAVMRELVLFISACRTSRRSRNDTTGKPPAGTPKALFCGPPGTGKTLAAGVVAGQLGVSLHRVDLSSVVSKYIGETEKNLARVFDDATTTDAVLLLDEADSLLGKRSEVKDSHDRYANFDTKALVERLEAHTGVVILRSNTKSNLDPAFLRRLRFVIEFPLPSEAERVKLWRKFLPKGADLMSDEAIGILTTTRPLTGSGIRAAIEAARLKAGAEGRPLTFEDLRQTIGEWSPTRR